MFLHLFSSLQRKVHRQIDIFPLLPNSDENTLTQFPSSKLCRPVTDSTGEGAPSLPIHIYISPESLIDGGCLPLHHVGNKVWTDGGLAGPLSSVHQSGNEETADSLRV